MFSMIPRSNMRRERQPRLTKLARQTAPNERNHKRQALAAASIVDAIDALSER